MRSLNSFRPGNQNRKAAPLPQTAAFRGTRRRIRAAPVIAVLCTLVWPGLGSSPASAAAGRDRLLPGEALLPGQSIGGGGDTLTMQGDGNLVLYAPGYTPIWASNTRGNNGAWLSMQGDGNLVVVARGGKPLWAAGTDNPSGSMLIVQSDGNTVIYTPGNVALWSTNTYKQTFADLQLAAHGWGGNQASQFGCLNNIWVRESGWNKLAGNPNYAYGIPQSDPGRKMASAGSDWRTNSQTQIRWGEDYIQGEYGSPCRAWAYWQIHHAY
jgi:hypothetical protein